jgi:4'-phosphopantetheinyl transferase
LKMYDSALWPDVGIVHVWLIDLERTMGLLPQLGGPLSPDERSRAERLKGAARKRTFIAGRTALRAVLGAYLETPASEVDFEYGPNGKPTLSGAASTLQFNISHSATYAVCAIAQDTAVGVDIEAVRPVSRALAIARDEFRPSELEELLAVKPAARNKAFLTCWTCKEAVLKALGCASANSMRDPEIDFTADDAPKLLSWQGSHRAAKDWTLRCLSLPPSFVGAMAVQGAVTSVPSFRYPSDGDVDGARLRRILSSQAAMAPPA